MLYIGVLHFRLRSTQYLKCELLTLWLSLIGYQLTIGGDKFSNQSTGKPCSSDSLMGKMRELVIYLIGGSGPLRY